MIAPAKTLSIVLMKVIILFLKLLNFLQKQGIIIGSNFFAVTLSLVVSGVGKSELVIFVLEIIILTWLCCVGVVQHQSKTISASVLRCQ